MNMPRTTLVAALAVSQILGWGTTYEMPAVFGRAMAAAGRDNVPFPGGFGRRFEVVGARWRDEIFRKIDQCDLFLLFWSAAARNSNWVIKEAERAIALQAAQQGQEPDIAVIVLDGPPIESGEAPSECSNE